MSRYMSRNEAEEYGIQLAKFGLLMDIINILDCEAVILSSAMFVVFLCKLCLMGVKEKIDKEKGTVFPMGMPIICRKMPFKQNSYAINKDLQHTAEFIFSEAPLIILHFYVLDIIE